MSKKKKETKVKKKNDTITVRIIRKRNGKVNESRTLAAMIEAIVLVTKNEA